MDYGKPDIYTEKGTYALTDSRKDGHLTDIAVTYSENRNRAWKESVQEAQAEIDLSHSDTRRYLCMPKDSVIRRGMRTLMLFFICIFCCHSVLTAATPPMFLYSFLKWKNYCSFCASVNISVRKLNLLLCLWFFFCIGVNLVCWNVIENILL